MLKRQTNSIEVDNIDLVNLARGRWRDETAKTAIAAFPSSPRPATTIAGDAE